MAKVVKYCAACEEGFAEKFGFCPNCGGSLAAYEMNPLTEKANAVNGSTNNIEAKTPSPVVNESPTHFVAEESAPVTETFSTDDVDGEILDLNSQNLDDQIFEDKPFENHTGIPAVTLAPETVRSSFNRDFVENNYQSNGNGASNGYSKAAPVSAASISGSGGSTTKYDDGNYHITFVEDKNASSRHLLLLGAFLLVTTVAVGGVVWSIFRSNIYIGSLTDDSSMIAYVGDDVPAIPEPEPPKPKIKDDAGGGGGGGREEPTPVSKGRLAPQMPEPQLITPSKTAVQKDFELQQQATTQGPRRVTEITEDRFGDPQSKYDLASDGQGIGGGQGSGRGTGQGSGRGTGAGSGIGSGMGSGIGNGIGGGRGDGVDGDGNEPPKVKPKGPTLGVSILSKPRPSYTDAARQNQVTGVVRLRVTFLASGQIGSVSPISGLSYGLTEQAIAAAKQIRFTPAQVNGVPTTVTKQIEYSFSIY